MTGPGEIPALRRFDSLSALQVQAAVRPDALAVLDDDRDLSFAALQRTVYAYCAELRERGVGPGDVVAVCLPNVWQYVALEIAVPALDAVLLPLPPRLGRHEFAAAAQRCNPRLVVAAGESWLAAEAGPRAVAVEQLDSGRADWLVELPSADPGRVVEIALTSGTTGLPKFASLTAGLKQLTFEAFTARLGVGPADRMLAMSPISQGVGEICMYVLRAGAGVVMTGQDRFDAGHVLRLAHRRQATLLGGVPTMIGRLLHADALDEADLSRLRVTAAAGAPLAPTLAREWERRSGSAVCGFYGAMDVGHLCVTRPSDPPEKRWTSVGRPHEIAEWQVCDTEGAAVRAGVEGEVCMRGPLVQAQYWNSAETPFAADGWAHFGDLGYVDEDGFLHITGRLKDTIIRGGENINPLEVENLLRHHPGVRDVAVIGRPDPDLGERAVACVVAVPGAEVTLPGLTGVLGQAGVARHKWPEELVLLDDLQMGITGKPDRARLRDAVAGRPAGETGRPAGKGDDDARIARADRS